MTGRARQTLLMTVLVMVALVVGSIGSATASGLTSQAVKKIAAKVVKKKAKTLTVANARALAGLPPSAYQDPAYSYELDQATGVTTKTWTLTGLPAGTYVASWTVVLVTSVGAPVLHCQLFASATSTTNEGFSYATPGPNSYESVSASAPVAIGSTSPRLFCAVDTGTFNTFGGDYPSRITFTKVDGIAQPPTL